MCAAARVGPDHLPALLRQLYELFAAILPRGLPPHKTVFCKPGEHIADVALVSTGWFILVKSGYTDTDSAATAMQTE